MQLLHVLHPQTLKLPLLPYSLDNPPLSTPVLLAFRSFYPQYPSPRLVEKPLNRLPRSNVVPLPTPSHLHIVLIAC